MREIQKHYNLPFSSMMLMDDSTSSLTNEDGYRGILVRVRCLTDTLFRRSIHISCFMGWVSPQVCSFVETSQDIANAVYTDEALSTNGA